MIGSSKPFGQAAMEVFRDLRKALPLVVERNWRRSLVAWVSVPFGCVTIMAICAGVRAILQRIGTNLPEQVVCLIILFVAMVLLGFVLKEEHMKNVVRWISIPLQWTLTNINLFFTPSFVMLPRTANPPSAAEVGKIIAVFVVGYCIMLPGLAWFMRGFNKLIIITTTSVHELRNKAADEKPNNHVIEVSLEAQDSTPKVYAEKDYKETTSPQSLASSSNTLPDDNEKIDSASSTVTEERHVRMAEWITKNIDLLTYLLIFIFVGIPVYYSAYYTMPAYLSMTTMVFLLAMRIPPKPKKALHPVVVTTCFTIMFIWVLAAIRDHRSGSTALVATLATYKTGNTYKQYFTNTVIPNLPLPGAGDILASLLDVSIIAFALPMYKYRAELLRFAIPLTTGSVCFCIGELLLYPIVTYHIGIASDRALAFAPRSLSLPLAVLAEDNLGGDIELTSVLAIMSGITGALLGLPMLRWWRIPDDDYVARGVSLGCNSSAIGAALLLETDETAAALASLSMNILGVLMIVLTLIPPVTDFVRSLVGL